MIRGQFRDTCMIYLEALLSVPFYEEDIPKIVKKTFLAFGVFKIN